MARAQQQFRRVIAPALAAAALLWLPAHAVVTPLQPSLQPKWAQLTPQQQQILAPLASEWDKLEDPRRVKWLGIADRYPAMQPEEQQRIQKQMLTWVRLTPEERQQAREKYKTLKKAPPEKREVIKQKWEEYKELPEEEKLRLKQQASKTPPVKAAKTQAKVTQPIKPLSQPPVLKIAPATPAVPVAAPTPTVAIPPTAPTPAGSVQGDTPAAATPNTAPAVAPTASVPTTGK